MENRTGCAYLVIEMLFVSCIYSKLWFHIIKQFLSCIIAIASENAKKDFGIHIKNK